MDKAKNCVAAVALSFVFGLTALAGGIECGLTSAPAIESQTPTIQGQTPDDDATAVALSVALNLLRGASALF